MVSKTKTVAWALSKSLHSVGLLDHPEVDRLRTWHVDWLAIDEHRDLAAVDVDEVAEREGCKVLDSSVSYQETIIDPQA